MDRSNPYEVAFASYLMQQRLCYVPVDETRRSLDDDGPVKSMDFIVLGDGGVRLVIDIKGRRFPSGPPHRPRRIWTCWSGRSDIDSLLRWADLAGPDYRGLLVFAYALAPSVEMHPSTPDLYFFKGQRFLFRAVDVNDYKEHMYQHSPSWQTVTLRQNVFRSLVRPWSDFLHPRRPQDVPF